MDMHMVGGRRGGKMTSMMMPPNNTHDNTDRESAELDDQSQPPASLRALLTDDQEDEQNAIDTYGKRQSQFPQYADMFSEMQGDERNHFQRLAKALAGLKG